MATPDVLHELEDYEAFSHLRCLPQAIRRNMTRAIYLHQPKLVSSRYLPTRPYGRCPGGNQSGC